MAGKWWIPGGALFLLFGLAFVLCGTQPALTAEAEEAVFDMRQISVFEKFDEEKLKDLDDKAGLQALQAYQYRRYAVMSGDRVYCTSELSPEVKAYPELKSASPLYGVMKLDRHYYDPTSGTPLHFVVDEVGAEGAGEAASAEDQSLLKSLTAALVGEPEPRPEEAKYDRLYFDVNGDLDLTNDPPVSLLKDPSDALLLGQDPKRTQVFDYVSLEIDCGAELGTRTLRLLPRLQVYGLGRAYLQLVPEVAWEGKIRIADQEYEALLAQSRIITGRFDRPFATLMLRPVDAPEEQGLRLTSSWLGELREADGQLYTISATPTGDKLTVAPYRGDFGQFEVGAGDGDVDRLGAVGSFVSDKALLTLGNRIDRYLTEKPRQQQLPVGDYLPTYLYVDYGDLIVPFSANRYPIDRPEDWQNKPPTFCVKIRKDKPFALDFAEKPAVVFLTPTKDEVLRPGSTVSLRAVLVDPALDLMIRDLQDTTQKTGELSTVDEQGERIAVPRYASLDPNVVITNSAGEEVAGGKMPFG
jgi:hypothetical protein